MSSLTVSEARTWAQAQAHMHDARATGDPEAIQAAADELEQLRVQLFEEDE